MTERQPAGSTHEELLKIVRLTVRSTTPNMERRRKHNGEKRKNDQKQKGTFKRYSVILKILVLSDPFYIVSGNYGSAHTLHSDFDR